MRVAVAATAFLLGLLLASPAGAITREQANAVALETLKPQTLTSPVVLYGLPTRVPARAVVSEFAKRGKLKGAGKPVSSTRAACCWSTTGRARSRRTFR